MLNVIMQLAGPVRFSGRYNTWAEAKRASGGYDNDVILNKVRAALLSVINGEAAYERDSVLFDEIQYSWPLAAGLLWVASQNKNNLNLIDFGGSLGSSYYQNRKLLEGLEVLRWNIVEQPKFIQCGKEHFENEHVRFYNSLDDCLREQHSDTILFSSVMQYLEAPYGLLQTVIDRDFRFILFDRTPFVLTGPDRLTVQKVSHAIYKASYPAWFFNREKFLELFRQKYEVVAEFDSSDRANISSRFKGFIFRRSRKNVQAY